MKRKVQILILTILIMGVSIVALTGCATFNNFRDTFFNKVVTTEETIKIGVLEPMTGNDSVNGQLEIDGIELANEMVPEVLGKKIELIYADTQGSIYTCETAVQDLINKEPAVILGTYGDACSLVAADYIEDARIPTIAMTPTNPLITLNTDYYFRTSFSEASQGYAIGEYVNKSLGENSAAVVKVKDDDASESIIAKFNNELSDLSENREAVATTIEVDVNEKDFSQYINQLKQSGVKAAFMPIDFTTAEKLMVEADKVKMYDVTFIFPKDLHTDEMVALQGSYPSLKIAVASDFSTNIEGTNELHDQFIKAYKEKFGSESEPSDGTALGFDAYMIAVQAMERCQSVEGKTLREALLNTKAYEGASGEITFNASGDPSKSINIDVIRRGEYRSVYTVE